MCTSVLLAPRLVYYMEDSFPLFLGLITGCIICCFNLLEVWKELKNGWTKTVCLMEYWKRDFKRIVSTVICTVLHIVYMYTYVCMIIAVVGQLSAFCFNSSERLV